MKILLRDHETGLYWGGNNVWVASVAAAQTFPTLGAAGQNALEKGSGDMEVVVYNEPPECDLSLNPVFCVPPDERAIRRLAA